MNARQKTLAELDDPETSGCLGSYLDVHAHNLAEQQREMLRRSDYDTDCRCEGCTACLLRDVIDAIDPRAAL